jgi:hypothetical protein
MQLKIQLLGKVEQNLSGNITPVRPPSSKKYLQKSATFYRTKNYMGSPCTTPLEKV